MSRMIGLLCVATLVFVAIAVSPAMAGPYAGAVIGLDVDDSQNKTNEGVTSAAASGTDRISVEIFATPVADPVWGASVFFDIDTDVLRIYNVKSPMLLLTPIFSGYDGKRLDFAALGLNLGSTGYVGTVTFEPQVDVTGMEFDFGITELHVVTLDEITVTDTLTTTTRLTFNSGPKATANVSGPVEIPDGGSASATITVTGFPSEATISHTVVAQTGVIDIFIVKNSATTFTITASGSGEGTITLTFTDGQDATEPVAVAFREPIIICLDFDGDGTIGFGDFFRFADAFGSRCGDPNYDEKYDLNRDCVVDFDDFFLFADAFGKGVDLDCNIILD